MFYIAANVIEDIVRRATKTDRSLKARSKDNNFLCFFDNAGAGFGKANVLVSRPKGSE